MFEAIRSETVTVVKKFMPWEYMLVLMSAVHGKVILQRLKSVCNLLASTVTHPVQAACVRKRDDVDLGKMRILRTKAITTCQSHLNDQEWFDAFGLCSTTNCRAYIPGRPKAGVCRIAHKPPNASPNGNIAVHTQKSMSSVFRLFKAHRLKHLKQASKAT
eukprot:4687814-Amphidinium_carterae.2